MGQLLKVKVRVGGNVQFPGICIHCSMPATQRMDVKKRSGRRTRSIAVPLCSACFHELNRESGEEERLHRLSRVATIALFFVSSILVFVALSALLPPLVNLLLSGALGLTAAIGLRAYLKRKRIDAALPEKKAILASAQMVDFSWRAATFRFENDEFADRFIDLNEEQLMEV